MSIAVVTKDVAVTQPVVLQLKDASGAHVILTVSIENRAPVTHAFAFDEGELKVPLDLPPGSYDCSFTVQAFKHGALSGLYDSEMLLNKKSAGRAKGNIAAARSFDVGFDDFKLTVG
jgi:hypothetical protein